VNHPLTGIVVSARNLSLAEDNGHDIITLCNGCTYTLKQANETLKSDRSLREEINNLLSDTGYQYNGTVNVRHFAEILVDIVGLDTIKKKTEIPLEGLKLASHTGCHILSPPDILGFDDPHIPVKLDLMIESIGATALNYSHNTQCCGWTLSNYGDRNAANRLLGDKLRAMRSMGADALNVICPQCLVQFDTGQMMASRALKLGFKLPALFYLQYLALAMGYNLDEVGYERHRVKDPRFEEKIRGLLS
jgi:heterodisulfide reductase subunit B